MEKYKTHTLGGWGGGVAILPQKADPVGLLWFYPDIPAGAGKTRDQVAHKKTRISTEVAFPR